MIQNPTFKACYHIEILPPEQVFLFDEKGYHHLLEGPIYVLLAPYLYNKTYSINTIIKKLSKKLSAEEIYYALLKLEAKGMIVEAQTSLSKPLEAFCSLLNITAKEAYSRIQKMSITVISLKQNTWKTSLEKKLKNFSLKVKTSGKITVVITDNYRKKELSEINKKAMKSQTPWLLVKPIGAEIYIGPLFVPGKTGCYECLSERLNNNHIEERFIEIKKKKKDPLPLNKATLPTATSLAFDLAANEIFKWIVQENATDLEERVISYDPFSTKIESHHFLKRPQCICCGTQSHHTEPHPIVLQSQLKRFIDDGGHRTVLPEETYKKYQHHVSAITGVVEHITAKHAYNSANLQIFVSGHNMAYVNSNNRPFKRGLRSCSAGKGKTEIQAKVSCLCEALERYSGVFQGNEIRKRASYSQIKDHAIHPSLYLHFSDKQYQSRHDHNKNCGDFHVIPEPFNENEETDWTPLWSLTEQRFKWIPTAFCYFNYPFSNDDKKFCTGDSNGSASGNTKEEAILQGFFELIERDSIALWWYSRIQMPGVDLSSFPDPYISLLISDYANIGRELWAIDITMDLKIPAFAAISRTKGEKENIIMGFGAHLDPKIALLRALTEMNQMLNVSDLHDQGASLTRKEQILIDWINNATLQTQTYLKPNLKMPERKYSAYEKLYSQDIKEDILTCERIIASKGMEMLVLDQTRPDIGLSVVKVVIPELRHFWNRYAKGRLYDVPLNLGLIPKKLKEEELNPIPMFL